MISPAMCVVSSAWLSSVGRAFVPTDLLEYEPILNHDDDVFHDVLFQKEWSAGPHWAAIIAVVVGIGIAVWWLKSNSEAADLSAEELRRRRLEALGRASSSTAVPIVSSICGGSEPAKTGDSGRCEALGKASSSIPVTSTPVVSRPNEEYFGEAKASKLREELKRRRLEAAGKASSSTSVPIVSSNSSGSEPANTGDSEPTEQQPDAEEMRQRRLEALGKASSSASLASAATLVPVAAPEPAVVAANSSASTVGPAAPPSAVVLSGEKDPNDDSFTLRAQGMLQGTHGFANFGCCHTIEDLRGALTVLDLESRIATAFRSGKDLRLRLFYMGEELNDGSMQLVDFKFKTGVTVQVMFSPGCPRHLLTRCLGGS